jgi:hypothetical protein
MCERGMYAGTIAARLSVLRRMGALFGIGKNHASKAILKPMSFKPARLAMIGSHSERVLYERRWHMARALGKKEGFRGKRREPRRSKLVSVVQF